MEGRKRKIMMIRDYDDRQDSEQDVKEKDSSCQKKKIKQKHKTNIRV